MEGKRQFLEYNVVNSTEIGKQSITSSSYSAVECTSISWNRISIEICQIFRFGIMKKFKTFSKTASRYKTYTKKLRKNNKKC